MKRWLALGLLVAGVGALGLQGLRLMDSHLERTSWEKLARGAPRAAAFDPAMVSALPDPARRYFLFAIAPGTPLTDRVELEMTGELSLGTKAKPDYMPMRASQILAGAEGFVWRVRAGRGKLWFSGSDGYADNNGWTRFWLYGLAPIVRAGGSEDYARSAAGRSIAESVFWAPGALLPSSTVRWEAVDADTARAIVRRAGHDHVVDLTVGPDGRPLSVSFLRWSRENPAHVWRLQPFGGTVGDTVQVGGYRLAAPVDGGNGFGTEDYFPFYKARVTHIRPLWPTSGETRKD